MSSIRILTALCSCVFLSFTAQAAPLKAKDLSAQQVHAIQAYHASLAAQAHILKKRQPLAAPVRPFSELEDAGYLFFSAEGDFDSLTAKQVMAKNLPAGVTLVVFTSPGSDKSDVLAEFNGQIDPTRLRVIELPNAGSGFWARDGLPIPVWNHAGGMDLVDAKYYHGFEPDNDMAKMFHSSIIKNSYYFEGGNFMVNDRGDCLTVDNDLSSQIPESVFHEDYGCTRVIRLPFEKGIGHADESLRFLRSDLVATDSDSYADTLRRNGFKVLMLPRPDNEYETYVNSLVIGTTVFAPVFGESNDDQAINVYKSAGFTVVPINTTSLSNDGLGSIHCITMTYPKVQFEDLLRALGAKEI